MASVWPGWFGQAMERWGIGGMAFLMFLDGACLPVPSEPVLAFAGFLAARQGRALGWVVMAANIAFVAGASVAYVLGRAGGRAAAARWGPALGMSPAALDRAEQWFRRWGDLAVFGGRFFPGVRTLVSLPAGAARMPLGRFLWLTFLGALPWSFGFAYAGHALGDRWRTFEVPWGWLAGGIAALLAGAIALRSIFRREAWRPIRPRLHR